VASYEVLIKRSAVKEIEGLPQNYRQRITRRISGLSSNPRAPGCEKLSGEDKYRLRQGDYRIVYSINDDARQVTVVKIAHRGDVYRRKK
jgi:mRNA interferase RelE/StbE